MLVDGTGLGFHTPFDAPFRRVRSHRKAVVLVDCRGGQRGVVGASWGGAYADEGRLWTGWLAQDGSGVVGSGALWVGDKL